MSPLRRPRGTCCSSEKQSRRNLRWMRLISPNNNRRELVLLSRPAQTMAIHANPRAKRSPAVLRMRKSSSAIHLSPHPPSVPSPTSAFDSSASAVGAQWCQTIDPYFRRRVKAWTRIRAVEHQEVSLVRRSLNSSVRMNDYIYKVLEKLFIKFTAISNAA